MTVIEPILPETIPNGRPGELTELASAYRFINTYRKADGSRYTPAGIAALSGNTTGIAVPIPASGAAQIISFTNSSYVETLTANTVHSFIGAVPGERCSVTIRMVQDSVGGHVPSFPGVQWTANPFTGFNGTSLPYAFGYTGIEVTVWSDDGGVTLHGDTVPDAPTVPNAPRVLAASQSASGHLTFTWQAPNIDGGSALTTYTYTLEKHSDHSVIVAATPIVLLTIDIGSLTNGTAYDFKITATNAKGTSTVATVTATPAGSVVAPTAVQSLTAAVGDTQSQIGWTAPLSDGGATVTYDLVVASTSGGTPTQVQKVLGGTSSAVLTTSATITTANLTAGNKLIVCVHHNSWTGTVAVTHSGGGTLTRRKFADNSDAHIEWWDYDIGVGEGKPTITFTLSGAGAVAGEMWMEVYEWSGLGAFDQSASGATHFGATAIDSGTTGTLAQAASLALVGFTFIGNQTPTYSNSYTSVDNNNRGSVAKLVTAATTATSTTATVSATDGIGAICVWKAASSFSQSHTNLSALTYLQTGLTNTTPYTVSVTPHNSAGNGPTSTTTVTPMPGGGGGSGTTPSLKALFGAQGGFYDATSQGWWQTTETELGMTLKFAGLNFGGLSSSPGTLGGVTISGSTLTYANHGMQNGDTVSTTGSPASGFGATTAYWVVNVTTNTFGLSATKGGSAISGGGAMSLTKHQPFGQALGLLGNFQFMASHRPDVKPAIILHIITGYPAVAGQTQAPPLAYRRSRWTEFAAGQWDSIINTLLLALAPGSEVRLGHEGDIVGAYPDGRFVPGQGQSAADEALIKSAFDHACDLVHGTANTAVAALGLKTTWGGNSSMFRTVASIVTTDPTSNALDTTNFGSDSREAWLYAFPTAGKVDRIGCDCYWTNNWTFVDNLLTSLIAAGVAKSLPICLPEWSIGPIGGPIAAVGTASAATDTFTFAGHGFSNGQRVVIAWKGTIPGGITSAGYGIAGEYQTTNVTANTFQLTPVGGGAVIDLTSDGSGLKVAPRLWTAAQVQTKLNAIFDIINGLPNTGGSSMAYMSYFKDGIDFPGRGIEDTNLRTYANSAYLAVFRDRIGSGV